MLVREVSLCVVFGVSEVAVDYFSVLFCSVGFTLHVDVECYAIIIEYG